jgi:hypothetical protein
MNRSKLDITSVAHTQPKNQSIGNCWLYAQASWLESLYKSTHKQDIDVSETYWTYWHFYLKLKDTETQPLATEIGTGGNWGKSVKIIEDYGWVDQADFIADDVIPAGQPSAGKSQAELCARNYLNQQMAAGGALHTAESRTEEAIRMHLDKAFSCDGRYVFDMEATRAKAHKAEETLLALPDKPEDLQKLQYWLGKWDIRYISNLSKSGLPYSKSAVSNREAVQGKKLMPIMTEEEFTHLEKRIKVALNRHQPVLLSFKTAMNARDYNLQAWTLDGVSRSGSRGTPGAHMVVLDDYTVRGVEGIPENQAGDLSDEIKTLALKGKSLDFLLIKNSWGLNSDGSRTFGRISWEYLTSRFRDSDSDQEETEFFLTSVVFPPGY